MDNREGLAPNVRLTPANNAWERDAALEMLEACPSPDGSPWAPTVAMTPGVSSGNVGSLE